MNEMFKEIQQNWPGDANKFHSCKNAKLEKKKNLFRYRIKKRLNNDYFSNSLR